MVRNEKSYALAVDLRKRGFTLAEIAKVCDVSKSTVSKWLKNKGFSADATKRNAARAAAENGKRLSLMAKARGTEARRRTNDALSSAKVEFENYAEIPAFRSGLMVYLAAGNRESLHKIQLSHSDVDVHRQFHSFLERFLGLERTRIRLLLHLPKGSKVSTVQQHWQRHTKLAVNQFYKPQIATHARKKPLRFGVGNTIIASTYHQRKLVEWVELARKRW